MEFKEWWSTKTGFKDIPSLPTPEKLAEAAWDFQGKKLEACLTAADSSANTIDNLLVQLAEFQAREVALRDSILLAKLQGSKSDRDRILDEALAQPSDDTALKALVNGERAKYTKAFWKMLAESQAREKVLRNFLHEIKWYRPIGSKTSKYALAIEVLAGKALQEPTDETALKALLAEEREKCSNVCEQGPERLTSEGTYVKDQQACVLALRTLT